jgi:hypothetical protein
MRDILATIFVAFLWPTLLIAVVVAVATASGRRNR